MDWDMKIFKNQYLKNNIHLYYANILAYATIHQSIHPIIQGVFLNCGARC